VLLFINFELAVLNGNRVERTLLQSKRKRDLKNGVHMILGITKIATPRFFKVTDFVNLKTTQTKTVPRDFTTKP